MKVLSLDGVTRRRVANRPFTFFAIMPTNNLLVATEPSHAGPASRALIETWGRYHAARSVLGLAATPTFLRASAG